MVGEGRVGGSEEWAHVVGPPRQHPIDHQDLSPQHFKPPRQYSDEQNAGYLAVQLVQYYYFGMGIRCQSMAGTLDQQKMMLIKDAILSKKCHQNKEAFKERCAAKKCNHLRYGK